MSMRSIISKIAIVNRTVRKNSVTLTHFMMQTEISLIDRILSNEHTQPMSQIVLYFAEIDVLLGP